jgi:hypothetical protein
MASSVNSPEDVINLSLVRMGYKTRIGSIWEGSMAAKKALDIYAQTRDAVLREGDWQFAEQITAATLTGNAAPFPWSFEYVYPTNCIKVRNLFSSTYAADTNNPTPTLWTVADNAAAQKVIWSKAAGATLVYTAQVTNPANWEPGFVEALVAALARRLAAVLVSPQVAQAEGDDESAMFKNAESEVG